MVNKCLFRLSFEDELMHAYVGSAYINSQLHIGGGGGDKTPLESPNHQLFCTQITNFF